MSELICPVCNRNGYISIKPRMKNIEEKKISFYAKCNKCGYESETYNTSNEVIDSLYKNKIDNK